MFGIGIYIFFLGCIWLFFIIKKLNISNFKNISTNIHNITNIIFFGLVIFGIIGFFIVVQNNILKKHIELNDNKSIENVYY